MFITSFHLLYTNESCKRTGAKKILLSSLFSNSENRLDGVMDNQFSANPEYVLKALSAKEEFSAFAEKSKPL
jgi:hypothetical protein